MTRQEVAEQADAYAYDLMILLDLERTFDAIASPREYAVAARRVSEAWEVAADAWEEVGDAKRQGISQARAAHYAAEAFVAGRPRLEKDLYLVDVNAAQAVAARNGVVLPRRGRVEWIVLHPHGPDVLLMHIALKPAEERTYGPPTWRYAIHLSPATTPRRGGGW